MLTAEEIQQICDSFQLSPEQALELPAKLTKAGYPGGGVISVDGTEQFAPVTIYMSSIIFDEYQKANHPESILLLLNQACKMGLFPALVKRCELNHAIVKGHITFDETKHASELNEKKLILTELNKDLSRLGNLYWSVGYLHAARVLLDIGNFYKYVVAQEIYNNMIKLCHEGAAQHFFRARLLLAQPISQKLMETIYQDQGFAGSGWETIEEASDQILRNIDTEQRNQFLATIQQEIEQCLTSNKFIHANVRKSTHGKL